MSRQARSLALLPLLCLALLALASATTLEPACTSILVVGDQGGIGVPPYTSAIQLTVAASMARMAEALNVSLVVGLGDNFYERGVTGDDDLRFQATFEAVYLKYPSLSPPRAPWRVVAGNHDWYGRVASQLVYPKWEFPALNHDLLLTLGDGTVVHLLFMDTFHLTSESHAGVPVNATVAKLTLEWLRSTLAESTADYHLLFTHYPYMSASSHGHNAEIEAVLRPILRTKRPIFYMAGHDHNLQHLVEFDEDEEAHHFVVGSGSRLDMRFDTSRLPPYAKLLFRWPAEKGPQEGGFASVLLCPKNVTVRLHSQTGAQKHQVVLPVPGAHVSQRRALA